MIRTREHRRDRAELAAWRLRAIRAERALDEILQNEREQAEIDRRAADRVASHRQIINGLRASALTSISIGRTVS